MSFLSAQLSGGEMPTNDKNSTPESAKFTANPLAPIALGGASFVANTFTQGYLKILATGWGNPPGARGMYSCALKVVAPSTFTEASVLTLDKLSSLESSTSSVHISDKFKDALSYSVMEGSALQTTNALQYQTPITRKNIAPLIAKGFGTTLTMSFVTQASTIVVSHVLEGRTSFDKGISDKIENITGAILGTQINHFIKAASENTSPSDSIGFKEKLNQIKTQMTFTPQHLKSVVVSNAKQIASKSLAAGLLTVGFMYVTEKLASTVSVALPSKTPPPSTSPHLQMQKQLKAQLNENKKTETKEEVPLTLASLKTT